MLGFTRRNLNRRAGDGKMRIRTKLGVATFVAMLASSVALTNASSAIAEPAWDVHTRWGPTHLQPGGEGQFEFLIRNVGTSPSSGTITTTVSLPAGVSMTGLGRSPEWSCAGVTTVTCMNPMPVGVPATAGGIFASFYAEALLINVAVDPGAEVGTHPTSTMVTGGGASTPGVDEDDVMIDNDSAEFGVTPGSFRSGIFDAKYPAGKNVEQAGAHPYEMRTDFDLNLETFQNKFAGGTVLTPIDRVRSVEVSLPRGIIGNPEATPKCSLDDFFQNTGTVTTGCPPETQIGTIDPDLTSQGSQFFGLPSVLKRVAIYNLIPPRGQVADLGFNIADYRGHIYPSLDPSDHYRIKTLTAYISSVLQVRSAKVTIWGVPADPAHDALRADPSQFTGYGASSNADIKPFLSVPMECGSQGAEDTFDISPESWQNVGTFLPPFFSPPGGIEPSGCDDPRIRFDPAVELQPTSRSAGGPTGLQVDLKVPQRDDTVTDAQELYEQNGDIQAMPTSIMKKAVVTFPEGMTISTSAAQGLGNCSPEQIGLGNNNPVTCPDSSQYGTLTLHTPLLPKDEPMRGQIFIAKQNDNPFNDFLAMYFVIEDSDRGLRVKLPGHIELDPVTGQIKTTFDDLPQFPIADMQLNFKGGVRAALVNPTTCGTKTIKAEFFSWSDPDTPKVVTDSYDVTQKPDGSPCVNNLAERPFRPSLEAGTVSPSAGSYSPFVFRLQRTDDDQEFSQLSTTLPPGVLANISKLTECSGAGITQASTPGRTGNAEALFPSCPASSQIGTTDVGSGVGQVLTYIPGKAYLAGPYKGAPLSMVVITPILAGPYDLGTIAIRSAIKVNPQTAQATIATDPFPQIFKGIPVRIRDIRVNANRPGTIVNPTSCDPMAVTARVTGTGGDVNTTADDTAVDLASRFQAANCQALPFKPNLSFKLKGGTKRGDFPALEATLRARPGDANIARSTVVLPRSEFIEQGHIRTVCTRVQFAANQCPPGSIYGKARATSPLFDEALEGPVYLRSNGGERLLPDLVVSLGGKIDVVLAGFIDSVKGRVRNTFDVIPDAPVTKFTLQMQGGKKGLLVNHLDLCKVTSRADVKFVGQNGKVSKSRPKMGTSCGASGRKGKGRGR